MRCELKKDTINTNMALILEYLIELRQLSIFNCVLSLL